MQTDADSIKLDDLHQRLISASGSELPNSVETTFLTCEAVIEENKRWISNIGDLITLWIRNNK